MKFAFILLFHEITGVVGEFPPRCSAQLKQKVLDMWEEAHSTGMTQKDFCKLIRLCRRRLRRWRRRDDLEDAKPGYSPGTAPHRLRSEDKEEIIEIARNEEDSDKAH